MRDCKKFCWKKSPKNITPPPVDGGGNADLHDYSQDYFTTTALEDNTIFTFDNLDIYDAEYFGYSLNNGETWVNETTTPVVNTGEKVLWKLDRINGQSSQGSGSGSGSGSSIPFWNGSCIESETNFSVSGNIMSLLYGDNFIGQTDLIGMYNVFHGLFWDCDKLISAENLVLPATTLADFCYSQMFSDCTSLTTAPELPATTLATHCYDNMFHDCTSLTSAPELPATTLASDCYIYMFASCISLTSAPELPATTLVENCYESMFQNCTSLTTAPELSATTLAHYCYSSMFSGCTSLTSAPELPATTLVLNCYGHMFEGCTSLTTAPELLANTLASSCYNYMFAGCTSLNYIKCLATDISASMCTNNWVQNVAAIGTFIKDASMSSWTTGIDGIPTGWAIENANLHDYSQDYLTFTALEDTTFGSWLADDVLYSLDDGQTWTTLVSNEETSTIAAGNKILWKSTLTPNSRGGTGTFTATGNFNVSGNIMSLLFGDNFIGQTDLTEKDYAFYGLFSNTNTIVSAENLVLPATTLATQCYQNMFQGCTSLTTAPTILPATTLATNCYSNMFDGCTSLTTAPELPATTLADYCYSNMFQGCTSLIIAPELPATTLATYCYYGMFTGCTSLTIAPELPATTLAQDCYNNMFQDCTLLTTAPELLANTLASSCYNYMFAGCTSLTTAPILPATTLAYSCYSGMFYGCILLNYIKCLATDISADSCTYDWVNGVSSTGTFVKPLSADWTGKTGTNGIPEGWTVQDAA